MITTPSFLFIPLDYNIMFQGISPICFFFFSSPPCTLQLSCFTLIFTIGFFFLYGSNNSHGVGGFWGRSSELKDITFSWQSCWPLPSPLFVKRFVTPVRQPPHFPFLVCVPDEFKSFMKRLPSNHFLTIGSIHQHWGNDWDLQNRYKLLQSSLEAQRQKIQRTARKLFGLSVRCRHNPNHQLPRERYSILPRAWGSPAGAELGFGLIPTGCAWR